MAHNPIISFKCLCISFSRMTHLQNIYIKTFIFLLQELNTFKPLPYIFFKNNTPSKPFFLDICIPDIGIMVRVFTNGPGDLGSIPGRVIPKT